MPKAFFAHASEDKLVVEAVYQRVLAESPDLAAWLDKYEILAGESLIERIAAGMDESDKFVIFLSPVSITKPWVNRELRRALMREIQGVDPNFIIPVLVGEISAVPPFLEDKKYIDLHRLTEVEWVAELVAAIRGNRPDTAETAEPNVIYRAESIPGKPHTTRVVFEARFWAARVSFCVSTSEDIVEARFEGSAMQFADHRSQRGYCFRCDQPEIRPGHPVAVVLEFAPDVAALGAIKDIGHWEP